MVLDPPPEAGKVIAILMAYHGPYVGAWRKAHPRLSWIRWCPQTFPDGCGMTSSGYPTSSLAALNPSSQDCELVVAAMTRASHERARAAAELESLAEQPTQFRRRLSDHASRLRFEIESHAVGEVKPGIHPTLGTAEERRVYDMVVKAAVAGFEFAIQRYGAELQHVPELQNRLTQAAEARREGAKKSVEKQRRRSQERAALARKLYESAAMTYAQIAEHFRTHEGMPTCNADTVRRWVNGKK